MIISFFFSDRDFGREVFERESRVGVWSFKCEKVCWGVGWGVSGVVEGLDGIIVLFYV